ncbi:MAG: thiamine pyrophosphate-dependent dehydrogenase E1 component subunit alpha [Oligoflexia bacterium]|nr:thiamine pyrophosphate-dependent dehydrogenase E1 component subunit alpha [Oligoflexia bacterium]
MQLYHRQMLVRLTEEEIAKRYPEGKMRCPVHLCTGQDAVSAAVGCALKPDDLCVSTHRSHGHYIGKGGDIKRMLAEIYGKAGGCSSGKGGSMHLVDRSVGYIGSTAIVGNTIPVGVGLGLSIKLKGSHQVSCVFFGDGAVEEGAFFEAANFAVLRGLPVLFLCENNFFSVYSPLRVRQPEGRKIHEMVRGLGLKAEDGDGNDIVEVYTKTKNAIDYIRSNSAPYFLEFYTYRWREHCGPFFDNNLGYRSEQEYLEWKERDPVELYRRRLVEQHQVDPKKLEQIDSSIMREIEAAFEFADASPFPEEGELYTQVFADSQGGVK